MNILKLNDFEKKDNMIWVSGGLISGHVSGIELKVTDQLKKYNIINDIGFILKKYNCISCLHANTLNWTCIEVFNETKKHDAILEAILYTVDNYQLEFVDEIIPN